MATWSTNFPRNTGQNRLINEQQQAVNQSDVFSLSPGASLVALETIPFNTVVSASGNFTNNAGVFTCVTPGTYLVLFQTVVAPLNPTVTLTLRYNVDTIISLVAIATLTSGSAHAVQSFARGDTLRARTEAISDFSGNNNVTLMTFIRMTT